MIIPLVPEMALQFTVSNNPKKSPREADFLVPLAGELNMVSTNGEVWKKWRSTMNPGFQAAHLMTLVPGIVDDALVFCEILEEHARKGDVFRMEDATTRLTVDIIGKVVL